MATSNTVNTVQRSSSHASRIEIGPNAKIELRAMELLGLNPKDFNRRNPTVGDRLWAVAASIQSIARKVIQFLSNLAHSIANSIGNCFSRNRVVPLQQANNLEAPNNALTFDFRLEYHAPEPQSQYVPVQPQALPIEQQNAARALIEEPVNPVAAPQQNNVEPQYVAVEPQVLPEEPRNNRLLDINSLAEELPFAQEDLAAIINLAGELPFAKAEISEEEPEENFNVAKKNVEEPLRSYSQAVQAPSWSKIIGRKTLKIDKKTAPKPAIKRNK